MKEDNKNFAIVKYSYLPDTAEIISAPKHGRCYMFNLLFIDIGEFNQFLDKLRADLEPSRNLPIIHAVYDSDHMFKVEGLYDEYCKVFDKGAFLYEAEQANLDFDLTVEQAKAEMVKSGFVVQIETRLKARDETKTLGE